MISEKSRALTPENQAKTLTHMINSADEKASDSHSARDKKFKLKIDKSVFIQEQKGKVKAKYRVFEILGEGTYGVVRRVIIKSTGEQRAMKTIKKEKITEEYLKSLMDEINILKQMDHPNIVKLYEFYQDKENFYIITELLSGGALIDELKKGHYFTEEETAKVMK